ncbi:cell division protein ZipA [uncultured Halomonas sp.]|uniref:cell division protein ZipA n=1 Tax=uncultured Halomonas sp. TaxID=173971 RepID=UPI00260BAA57|nr:cell division protein ZipA [uncultured Halomonas sp.]
MELREWLIILGLALVTLIVVDGVRRLQRQRRVPRLDAADDDTRYDNLDREAETNWELPNGGARVVRPADYTPVQPKPKLERQEHPGPSRVLSGFRQQAEGATGEGSSADAQRSRREPAIQASREPVAASASPAAPLASAGAPGAAEAADSPGVAPATSEASDLGRPPRAEASAAAGSTENAPASGEPSVEAPERREPSLSALDDEPSESASRTEAPLAAEPEDHDDYPDDERYRLVDLEGMGDSLKSGSQRMGVSMRRFGASLQKSLAERREQKRLEKARREKEKAEKAALEAERQRLAREQAEAEREQKRQEALAAAEFDDNDPLFAPPRSRHAGASAGDEACPNEPYAYDSEEPLQSDKVHVHPVLEKALRHDVSAEHARETLGAADELIVISVMSREEEGFSGAALLNLMLACGLRYDRDMGVFHRFETEDPESRLQFSMVNVVKPGTFPITGMDEFRTPGITLLMPLPGAEDASASFEAMVETAMVIVRNLGGELKDENHSVMTAQTVEFARQRVQDFVRRHRLHRYQVN